MWVQKQAILVYDVTSQESDREGAQEASEGSPEDPGVWLSVSGIGLGLLSLWKFMEL